MYYILAPRKDIKLHKREKDFVRLPGEFASLEEARAFIAGTSMVIKYSPAAVAKEAAARAADPAAYLGLRQSLLSEYEDWVRRARRGRVKLARYTCPNPPCKVTLHTPRPPSGEQYSSMTECPYCNTHHYKVTKADGHVSATLP